MRQLTSLKDQQQANRLIAWLAVQAIESTSDYENDEWVIWIHNDDDRQKASEALNDFLENPNDAKFENAERKVRHVLKEADRLREENDKRAEKLKKRWNGSWWHCYPATYIMIGICIAVVAVSTQWKPLAKDGMGLPYFCNDGTSVVLQQMMMVNKPTEKAVNEQNEQDVIAAIEKAMNESPPNLTMLENLKQRRLPYTQMKVFEVRAYSVGLLALVRTGELWRMVTPAFIHLSLLHLLMNMMAFKNLGCATEFIRGTPKYLTLCLILAVASSCGQFVWDGPKFGGMSGVLFGLVGYIWVKGKTQPRLGLGLSSRGVTFVGLWLFLCIAGVFGPVANAAHVVGLIAGIIVGGRQAVYKKLGLTRDGPKAGSG